VKQTDQIIFPLSSWA